MTIERRYTVQDPREIAQFMDTLSASWDRIVSNSLKDALSHDLRTAVLKRVPESNRHRYPNDPERGLANLRKDFDIVSIRVAPGDVSYRVGFANVEYAEEVHDKPDPSPSGRPVKWSKPGSGNEYLSGPVHETKDLAMADFNRNVAAWIDRVVRV